MHRHITRTLATLLTIALLACSRDGRAATQTAARPGGDLFREAAATQPAAEAQVPAQASLAPIIERLRPAVVNISTTTVMKHPRSQRGMPGMPGPRGQDPFQDFFERYFGQPMPEAPDELRGQSLGSGFVLSAEGFILTNNHVVKDATDILVTLSDGRQFKAEVVGKDAQTDVALIRLVKPPKDLTTVLLGDSDALRQGDFVLALGSPLGLRDTATFGIVSAKHRTQISQGTGTYDDFIQTDAAINPGNSGGPLFTMRGEVIGINTAIVRPDVGQGIGFAVPINLAKSILPQLREKGKVTRGFMGVQVSDLTPDLAQAFDLAAGTKGALVQSVVPRGPAAKAGVEPGDLVVALNGKAVDSASELTRSVALVPPGKSVELTVLRKGAKKQLSFKVAQRPEDEGVAARGEGGESEEGGAKADKSQKLGVSLAPLTQALARELGIASGTEGVVVTDVAEGGPAQRASLRRGDVIVEVNRQAVKKPEDVASIVGKMKEGQMALLRIRRGDQTAFIAVPVGGRQ